MDNLPLTFFEYTIAKKLYEKSYAWKKCEISELALSEMTGFSVTIVKKTIDCLVRLKLIGIHPNDRGKDISAMKWIYLSLDHAIWQKLLMQEQDRCLTMQ